MTIAYVLCIKSGDHDALWLCTWTSSVNWSGWSLVLECIIGERGPLLFSLADMKREEGWLGRYNRTASIVTQCTEWKHYCPGSCNWCWLIH